MEARRKRVWRGERWRLAASVVHRRVVAQLGLLGAGVNIFSGAGAVSASTFCN